MKLLLVAGLGGAIGSTLATALAYGGTNSAKLGMVTNSPKFNKLNLPFDDFDDLAITGWDVNKTDVLSSVKHHACVPDKIVSLSESQLKSIPLRNGLIANITNIKEWFNIELSWLDEFRDKNNITSVVVINLCPTEPEVIENYVDWENIDNLSWQDTSVTPGRLYFRFAIESGAHFINFTPNCCEIEPLASLSLKKGTIYSGRDGKTGQTFLKTLLAPAFRDKNFKIDGWFSTNILGNGDGLTLSDSSNVATKINSKRECLSEILGYDPGNELSSYSHQVNIHYYPPRGDAKEAWDNIDFSGMFNQKMQLKLNWLGWDSILAAPAVLDLARLIFQAESAGFKGLLDSLGYFYKTPLTNSGQERVHDIDIQYARLFNWAEKLKDQKTGSDKKVINDIWGWPKWPQQNRLPSSALEEILDVGTMAISGERLQNNTEEELFCKEFSDFIGMKYGVACSTGSAALSIALEASGVCFGNKVLVPPSPWVACASSVLSIGGIPVFCDLDPSNLCMCPEEAEAKIDKNVKAIIIVHSLCSVADIDRFIKLSKKYNIPLIEDCSQAHGATYNGRKVGSFGRFSTFSMQQTKVLTSGEGGVVLCNDLEDYETLQELRADGRVWNSVQEQYSFHLAEKGTKQGFNYCLSEIQSKLLRTGLENLMDDNKLRASNALSLNESLNKLPDVKTYFKYDYNIKASIYEYAVSLPVLSEEKVNKIAEQLTSMLGVRIFSFDLPIYRHRLYKPQFCNRFPQDHINNILRECNVHLPVVENFVNNTITFPHRMFLGNKEHMNRIEDAIESVI